MNASVDILNAFCDLLAEKIELRLRRAGNDEWISQAGSRLGPRRHVAAVKRRLVRGEPGARVDRREYFLSREALLEELALVHGKSLERTSIISPPITKAAAKNDMLTTLRAVRSGKR